MTKFKKWIDLSAGPINFAKFLPKSLNGTEFCKFLNCQVNYETDGKWMILSGQTNVIKNPDLYEIVPQFVLFNKNDGPMSQVEILDKHSPINAEVVGFTVYPNYPNTKLNE